MNGSRRRKPSVLVTGAGGYIGRLLVAALSKDRAEFGSLVAADIRETDPVERLQGIEYLACDIRSPELANVIRKFEVNTVVHLASIVTPGRKSDRAFEYSVDVLGTENVVECCLREGVDKLIVTSSGAAYGYYADNPPWLVETDALRGNPEFAYSDHKRQVEEMLAGCRQQSPGLKQLIFRPGTILGRTARNQITALFEKPFVIGLRGSDSPFVLIWDRDVVNCLLKGMREDVTGIYNLAGDGVLTLREMARLLGKPYLPLPVGGVRAALWLLKRLGLSQYGPEQVNFLRYRPVLSNRRLKEGFGYIPEKSTREVFEFYISQTAAREQ